MLQQFENPANPKVHRETTGPEIWRDTEGAVEVFVSGVGTGGTVTGVSQFIKGCPELGIEPKNPNLYTVAVEPEEQMLLTAARGGEKIGEQGPHKIQGMGAGIVPQVLDLGVVDEVVPVHSEAAMAMTSRLWLEEGLPVGVSSGAIVEAAVRVMRRPEMKGKLCVAILPSFGERYFTVKSASFVSPSSGLIICPPLFESTCARAPSTPCLSRPRRRPRALSSSRCQSPTTTANSDSRQSADDHIWGVWGVMASSGRASLILGGELR
mmetsp:Transcript_41506/g.93599  ORF Transcript_41506/g.93599 Transcript_41506/m.93599 type:complete len:266 (+) Transcript_41506:717-1514(+)